MAVNAPRAWLIAYDIADKKRLSRLGRFIKKHAIPVQYSLYYFEGSGVQIGQLMASIAALIDPKKDDVRAYPLPLDLHYDVLGKGSLPASLGLMSPLTPALAGLLLPAAPHGV